MSPYQLGAYKYTTPGGHRYSLQMRVKAPEEMIINQIIDEGFARGLPEESISIVAATAFQESTFVESATNAASSAMGIFQFLIDPWSERHKDLDRTNTAHQIAAMYDDLAWFRGRYTEHLSAGKIDGATPFVDYAYASHTAGPFDPRAFAQSDATKEKVTAFRDKWLTLALHVE